MYTTYSSPVAISYSMCHNQRLQPQQGLDAEPPTILANRKKPSLVQAAILQYLSHGFVSAFFFTIGVLYDRWHSRVVKYYGWLLLF